MKKGYFLLIAIFYTAIIQANIYTVHFGTHYGNNYIPNAMIINLGDTVLFSGTFALLPLKSDIIPFGADSFSCDTSTEYMYIPTVIGTHNYHCSVDATMIGSFYVQNNVGINSNHVNPFQVSYSSENKEILIENIDNEEFKIDLFDNYGRIVFSDKNISRLKLSNKFLENAIYYLQIRKKDFIFTEKIFIY